MEIYDSFLSSISDYTLIPDNFGDAETEEKAIEGDLAMYFNKARRRFRKCRQRLDTIKDNEGREYFGYKDSEHVDADEDGNVTVALTGFEIDIIVQLMLVEYMKPQLIATEVMKQSLSDKDFRIYSQANQLRELNLLYRLLQREARGMMTEYTYEGIVDDAK